MHGDTIYALSSGALPSGVAVIRISGAMVPVIVRELISKEVVPRQAELRSIFHPESKEKLDDGLVLLFPKPNSFTGEDVLEIQCHGGIATVDAILQALGCFSQTRAAERGEFSRRAFENGRLDLTQVEGLADLLVAQTESQRRLALSQAGGALRDLYEGWRSQIIRSRALIEAELDFSEEEDVPGGVSDQVWLAVESLKQQIEAHLCDDNRGEIIRRGYRVALLGPPNAGKSSLLNALALRDVAIVTEQAGTTRDVLEVPVRIGDHLVVFLDTAGLRDADDVVEVEGIRRAKLAASEADLILWLSPVNDPTPIPDYLSGLEGVDILPVSSKADIEAGPFVGLAVSSKQENGIIPLISELENRLTVHTNHSEEAVLTRARHRDALFMAVEALTLCASGKLDIELRSENLRIAGDHLGRLTGRIDVEDLLDVIFSEFCVGK